MFLESQSKKSKIIVLIQGYPQRMRQAVRTTGNSSIPKLIKSIASKVYKWLFQRFGKEWKNFTVEGNHEQTVNSPYNSLCLILCG